ncbi:MAG: DNA repair protein RadC [Candidatus Sericytochromatia bacterium]
MEKEHYHEHRQRLKKRYKTAGRKGLADYELIELLLTYALPRKDVKPLAKLLLKNFKSIRGLLDTPASTLEKFDGLGEHSSLIFSLVKDLTIRYFEPDMENKVVLSSPEAVADFISKEFGIYSEDDLHSYLKAEIGNQEREFFMVICLNSSNQIIQKKVLFAGTIDQAQVYPREIIKLGLIENASAIILVHNHPSGNSKPSQDDLILTDKLEELAKQFNMRIHDHIIVTGHTAFSIKANRLMNL